MKTLWRSISEFKSFWFLWSPLLLITAAVPWVSLSMPLVQKNLIDNVFLAHRLDLLAGTVATYGLLWIAAMVLGIARSTLQTYLNERITLGLRQRLLAHCSALSLGYWHREHNGRTITLFQSDVARLASLFTLTVVGGLAGIIGTVLGAVMMFRLSWQLAIVAAIGPPLITGLAAVVTRPLRPASRRVQEKVSEINERLQENLAGIREIIAFGRERTQGEQFTATLQDLLRLRMRLTAMDSGLQIGDGLFSLLVSVIILGYGGFLFIQGAITLGSVIAIQAIFTQTFQTAKSMFGVVKEAQMALASADRVYDFLDEVPQVGDRPDAQEVPEIHGEVTFDNVSFAYEPNRPVLQDVSFTTFPGELVALVGESGAGKSTLASLIARFYDPLAGRISLDGYDLRNLKLASLRRHIGIVFQDTFLFATTVRENLAFGCEGASEEQIIAAARAAHAWEFIQDLPNGLDSRVGQRGAQLSEGQKQRLAIARALLRNPRILILDEPTSALDARSESLVQLALANLIRGRTTFVIAHRLATILRADRILVVDRGRIVQQGSHAELLLQPGIYRQLYELQFAGAQPSIDPQLAAVAAVSMAGGTR